MNILLINYEYPPIGGGAATATYNLARQILKRGHSVSVLTSRYKELRGNVNEEGINVFRCNSSRRHPSQSNISEMFSFVFSASFALKKIIRAQNIKGAIIFFTLPCGPLGLLCKYLYNVPYIISLRGGDVPGLVPELNRIHFLLTPVRRVVLKNALCIAANSNGLKNLSESADSFPVKVIPNGVDTDFFCPQEKLKDRPFQFLFVGRFQPQKNLFLLLDQVAVLAKSSEMDFSVHLVGDGPLKQQLFNHAGKLNLNRKIIWHNWLDKEKLRQLYRETDCLVNPSLYEGMPNVVLEAMACGLPVIASNVAGNETLVRQGETGFLFNLNCPGEFQQALITVMQNSDTAKRLGNNGRRRALQDFSWQTTADEYLKLMSYNSGGGHY